MVFIGIMFFMGANGLRTFIPLGTPGNILSGGLILPLNICVALVVASMMYMLYSLFSHWGGRLD
jgi:multicomponent Na+:H+ antiporter subunit B